MGVLMVVRYINWLCLISLTFGCSNSEFSGGSSAAGPGVKSDLGQPRPTPDGQPDASNDDGTGIQVNSGSIGKLCSTQEIKEHKVVIDFGAQSPGCPWGKDGNLAKKASTMTARKEVTRTVALPDAGPLCGATFKSVTSNISYDDALFVTINGVELFTTWAGFSTNFRVEDGFRMWDWQKIVGKTYSPSGNVAGCMGKSAKCTAPIQEKSGKIEIELNPSDVQRLFTKFKDRKSWDFMIAATGDDDPSLDCSHSNIAFEATFKFAK